MGLFDKIKDILFVEDEELPVITKKEEEHPVVAVKDEVPKRSIKRDVEVKNEDSQKESVSLRSSEEDKKSPFLSFDEEEFELLSSRRRSSNTGNSTVSNNSVNKNPVSSSITATKSTVNNNVVQTTTTTVKKVDYKDYSRYEVKKVEERKPFAPSPVISPVYGILDKNYKKEDVVNRVKNENTLVRDVDQIRRKAFGEEAGVSFKEEDVLPKKAPDRSIDDLIMAEFDEVDSEEVVSESLTDDIEVGSVIDLENDVMESIEPVITHFDEEDEDVNDDYQLVDERTSALEILDEIERELSKQSDVARDTKDTLEGDLFNLIDSMYDDSRKGEEE